MENITTIYELAKQLGLIDAFFDTYGKYIWTAGLILALLNCLFGYKLRKLWGVLFGFLVGDVYKRQMHSSTAAALTRLFFQTLRRLFPVPPPHCSAAFIFFIISSGFRQSGTWTSCAEARIRSNNLFSSIFRHLLFSQNGSHLFQSSAFP